MDSGLVEIYPNTKNEIMNSINYVLVLVLIAISTACGSLSSQQKTKPKSLKIASYNVRNAKGMDNVVNFDRIAKVINNMNADAIAIQELDSATVRSNGLVVLHELAKRTGMFASYNASIEYNGGKYGIGILTKEKPLRMEAIALPGREEMRSILVVELKDYALGCTHFSLNEEDRQSSIELIQKMLSKYESKPVFLAGDLNALPNSEEIAQLKKDWTMISNPDLPTFPSDSPTITIDYVFLKHNNLFKHTVIGTEVVNEPMASDHRPIWVEINIDR